MSRINKNKKFMSTLLIGTSVASLAASNTANTIGVDGVKSSEGFHLVQKGFNFLKPYLNSTAKIIKAPWSAYKWVTFDMVPKVFSQKVDPVGIFTPVAMLAHSILGVTAAFAWLAVQAAVVCAVGATIYVPYKLMKNIRLKNKISELENKYYDGYIFKVDGLLTETDEIFIKNIEAKFGENYAKKLEKEYRKKILDILLENEDRPEELKNCKTYFESTFVVNNPESEKYFTENKYKPEKDYGLIGPNRFSADDLKFINEELPKMKDEIDFLKKLRNFENDEDVIKDVRKFIAECYHFCNKNKYTSLDGRMWFLCFYMKDVRNIDEIKKINEDLVTQFICIGSDFSVEKNWYKKEKNYGLLNDDLDYACKMRKRIKDVQSKRISRGLINLVKKEEYEKFREIAMRPVGDKNYEMVEKVKNAFKKYVFYLHGCNKEIKKAEKGFDDFLKDEKVTVQKNLEFIFSEDIGC